MWRLLSNQVADRVEWLYDVPNITLQLMNMEVKKHP